MRPHSSPVVLSPASPVFETGFGFTTPAVALTGGGGTGATARPSGGVDNVTVTNGGVYAVQPIVVFGGPDLPNPPLPGVPYTQATGTATMNASGVVTSVDVVDPGTGYTAPPTVTIFDGTLTQVAPTPAVATATINIGQIDIITGGAG